MQTNDCLQEINKFYTSAEFHLLWLSVYHIVLSSTMQSARNNCEKCRCVKCDMEICVVNFNWKGVSARFLNWTRTLLLKKFAIIMRDGSFIQRSMCQSFITMEAGDLSLIVLYWQESSILAFLFSKKVFIVAYSQMSLWGFLNWI